MASESGGGSGLSSWLAGSTSGLLTTTVLQPLDVIKTRLQSHLHHLRHVQGDRGLVEPGFVGSNGGRGGGRASVVSMANVFRTIVEANGVKGLWSGLGPTVLRTAPGTGVYFSLLSVGEKWIRERNSGEALTTFERLCLGASSRGLVSILINPVTVVKTQMESGSFVYNGTFSAIRSIYSQQGVRGLFLGVGATVARDAPFSAIYYATYKPLKPYFMGAGADVVYVPEAIRTFTCGLVAGSLATIATNPQDVIKTRLQLDPERRLSILRDLRAEGISWIWKGLAPRILRRSIMVSLTWTCYEKLVKLFDSALGTTPVEPGPPHV